MLTRELGIVVYERARAIPDRLTGPHAERYKQHAARMLNVYRLGIGKTRQELHRSVHGILAEEADCPMRRVDAFCKLLDDASDYDRDLSGQAASLRMAVFQRAAPLHPLVRSTDRLFENEEVKVKAEIAAELGRPWHEIDGELFADIIEFQRLRAFTGYPDAAALVHRYNIAQIQVALFDATRMTVRATRDFKLILRYARLARLMHRVARTGEGAYELQFDGPASVLRETRRYGVALARFLPALIACRDWRMSALLQTRRRGWYVRLDLSSEEGLQSHLPAPEEFDSRVEEAFARRWGNEPREGWTLHREGEILHRAQKTFIPDFVFAHDDGRTVPMEIVGFWTPEYLLGKLETLRSFADRSILLAVADNLPQQGFTLPHEVIPYKSSLKVSEVMERLRRL